MGYPWHRYSNKLIKRIEQPRWAGSFDEDRGLRLVTGFDGSVEQGNAVKLFWLVDESDGVIADAKFLAFGQSALIGAADAVCELCRGKNYDQANRIGADLVDKHLRDVSDRPAFPAETSAHLNLAIGAIEDAASKCQDLPLPENYVTPIEIDGAREGGYPGFDEMPKPRKLALIEQVIAEDVRPYVELDAGGIEVIDLLERELLISYSGSCTSCHAATGTTLSAIQQIVRAKIHPELIVVPEL